MPAYRTQDACAPTRALLYVRALRCVRSDACAPMRALRCVRSDACAPTRALLYVRALRCVRSELIATAEYSGYESEREAYTQRHAD